MSTLYPTRAGLAARRSRWQARGAPSSSRARSIFLQSSVTPATVHSLGDRFAVFALAFFVLVVIVGGAFAAGYLIGRILL
jgi:hypothetical protein